MTAALTLVCIGGYELGLDPNASSALAGNGTSITYWGVKNLDAALAQLVTSKRRFASPPSKTHSATYWG